MSLSIGIVGLPNVGKSSLFNALTNNNVLAANYPFATIEPNTGMVSVPDERLTKLAEIYSSQKIIPATVTFIDIAGLVAGASKGEGLGNQFLSNIRNCNAIAHVVRAFDDANVTHVDNEHNPQKDIDVINTELVIADLQTVDKRLPQLEKMSKSDPKQRVQFDFALQLKNILESNTPIHKSIDLGKLTSEQLAVLQELQLLTAKRVIYVFNVDEAGLVNKERRSELSNLVAPAKAIFVCAKLENELQSLDLPDQIEMLQSYGVKDSGLIQLIHSAFEVLGLQSYLTAGEKEVRAWTIKVGATAPQAAGVIHGDFEKGFIAAQVIDYYDLLEAGSEAKAKSVGKVRTEGKTYVMGTNDVVEFRFNV